MSAEPAPAASAAATETATSRILTLDILRGVAVMGILGMNIVGYGMPVQAYLNYLAYGAESAADLAAWALSFVFIDGKMRAMFSMLFGASMLIIIERATAAGEDGASVHFRRMAWLLVFGLIHYFFIWWGDILTGYALAGLFGYLFTATEPRALMRWSLVFFAIGFIVFLGSYGSILALEAAAAAPGATADVIADWRALEPQLGRPTETMIVNDLGLYRGRYARIVEYQIFSNWPLLVQNALIFLPETLALMLLGMWGLRTGFLTGEWEARRYRRIALICLGITVPAYALLAWAMASSGFRTALTINLQFVASVPLRPVMMIGYTALIILVLKGGREGRITRRVAAAGRAAFSNYLGTSIVAITIFYGFGLGLYGQISRAELYLVALAICLFMLIWSKPWLDRFHYGPLEWLWRSLARWRFQPMMKDPAASA